jgi:FMN phosphatase YigB (HAD superfamily)|uniref:HAD family hydrolase n=1 Tax=Desulfobacca acetoxidans TaxID=60893 RepID=A0A7V6A5B3_9BACT
MTEKHELVFLFDVDNTLLNNDCVERDLRHHLSNFLGPQAKERFFQIFEELRAELGYADYLGTLERYRLEALHDPRVLAMSCWLVDYPFSQRLYPHALDAVEHARGFGVPVILSDGDAVFQPRKIERSGLWDAFRGQVLIYVHKEKMLGDVECYYPAGHYVMVDDKLRLLSAIKAIWQDRVTTVFVKQGHYANDPAIQDRYPPADIKLNRIGDLLEYNREAFLQR